MLYVFDEEVMKTVQKMLTLEDYYYRFYAHTSSPCKDEIADEWIRMMCDRYEIDYNPNLTLEYFIEADFDRFKRDYISTHDVSMINDTNNELYSI